MKEEMSDTQPQLSQASKTLAQLPRSTALAPHRTRPARWLLVSLAGILVLAAGISALVYLVHRQSASTPASGSFHPAPCPFKPAAGVGEGKDVRCGYLSVPEDHSHPQGSTLRLAVAIFKAPYTPSASDPVLYLAGGPGDQVLGSLGPYLTPVNIPLIWPANRDLILLDQRGEGYSHPRWTARSSGPCRGEYDPVTSPAYGKLAARTLAKSSFSPFPGTGHAVLGTNTCAHSLFQALVDLPNQKPDSTCMAGMGAPPFG